MRAAGLRHLRARRPRPRRGDRQAALPARADRGARRRRRGTDRRLARRARATARRSRRSRGASPTTSSACSRAVEPARRRETRRRRHEQSSCSTSSRPASSRSSSRARSRRRARVGARALLAADRDLDGVPDRQRRADRHGLRDRPRDPRLQRRHRAGCRRRRSSWSSGCATATRACTSSCSSPSPRTLERMVGAHGPNLFNRVGRPAPALLQRPQGAAADASTCTLDAWITGLRRDQWASRTNIRKVEIDHDHGAIVKLNPLAEWTEDEVWDYVREHDVPYHPLYDRGYTSIGCAPCTRAIEPGEAARAGRWWWETNAPKECGIHCAIETGGLEHELHAILGEDDDELTPSPLKRRGRGGRARRGAGRARDGAGRGAPRRGSPTWSPPCRRARSRRTTQTRSRSCSSSGLQTGRIRALYGPGASRPRWRSTGACRAAASWAESAREVTERARRARGQAARRRSRSRRSARARSSSRSTVDGRRALRPPRPPGRTARRASASDERASATTWPASTSRAGSCLVVGGGSRRAREGRRPARVRRARHGRRARRSRRARATSTSSGSSGATRPPTSTAASS